MIKFTLLVFLFTVISTSYQQELSNGLADLPKPDNSGNPDLNSPLWPLQGLRRKVKPCHRRRNNNGNEPWIPSYSSKITHPLYEPGAVLQPQALKNENLKDNNAVLNRLTENQQTLLNPVIQQDSYQWLTPGKDLAASDPDEDCAEQLDATDGQAEEKALKIIEDCLKKKQRSNIEETLLNPSRRSFFGTQTSKPGSSEESGELFKGISQGVTDLRDGNKQPENRRKATTNDSPLDITTKSADTVKDSSDLALRSSIPNPRICYACSTASNPSCWEPNNRTTIKYCAREYSCVTKTYGFKDSLTLIRDCANSCKDTSIPGLEPKYKSCKLCHHDYCNSATSIAGYNFIIVLVIGIFKCTF